MKFILLKIGFFSVSKAETWKKSFWFSLAHLKLGTEVDIYFYSDRVLEAEESFWLY